MQLSNTIIRTMQGDITRIDFVTAIVTLPIYFFLAAEVLTGQYTAPQEISFVRNA